MKRFHLRFIIPLCLAWLPGACGLLDFLNSHDDGSDDETEVWTTVSLFPGDDLAQAVADASPRTMILLSEGVFELSSHGSWDYGVLLENKTDLVIRGQGRFLSTVKLPADLDFGFYVSSNLDGIALEDFGIEGTRPLATNTHAIGNYTGVGYSTNIRRIRISKLYIKDVAVGISIANWYEGNVYDGVEVTENLLEDLWGVESGSGYGIHIDNPTNAVFSNNFVKNAQRHGIYHGRSASGAGNLVQRNVVFEHDRYGDNPLNVASALVCARSSDVRLMFNTIIDSRTYSMSVEPDDVFAWPSNDVFLVGNSILGAMDAGLWIATGLEHVAVGNTISQAPGNQFPELRLELSPGSGLEAPFARWDDPDLAFDYITQRGSHIYILKNDELERILPFDASGQPDWSSTTASEAWPGARYLVSGPDGIYVGLADGGYAVLDPVSLDRISGSLLTEDILTIAIDGPESWTADGVTGHRVDVTFDCSNFGDTEFCLAEWDLVLSDRLTLSRSELPGAGDFFAGFGMDSDDDRIDATSAGGVLDDNIRLVLDVFDGPSARSGILGSYWFTLAPGSDSTPELRLTECRVLDTDFVIYTQENGLTVCSN